MATDTIPSLADTALPQFDLTRGGVITIKIGVMFANGGRSAEPGHAIRLAQSAEADGYDSLWAVQHVVIPIASGSRYPYSSGGTIRAGSAVAIPDLLVWLAYIASATTSIRLATGVVVLPQQPWWWPSRIPVSTASTAGA